MKSYDKLKAEIEAIQLKIVLAKNYILANALDYFSVLNPLNNDSLRCGIRG